MGIPNTSVILLKEGYTLKVDNTGQVGSRKYKDYIEGQDDPDLEVLLPDIGDPWSNVYSNCISSSITYSFMGNCDTKLYDVEYSAAPDDTTLWQVNKGETPDVTKLPVSLTLNSDYDLQPLTSDNQSATGAVGGSWYYESGNKVYDNNKIALIGLPKRNINMGIVIPRYVWTNDFNAYMAIVASRVGKVNSDIFRGFPSGLVLFTGIQSQEVTSVSSERKWLVNLNFAVRMWELPGGGDPNIAGNGWNKILNPKTWEAETVTYVADAIEFNIYNAATFATLLSYGQPSAPAYPQPFI